DWSSDVCSSDLAGERLETKDCGRNLPRILPQNPCLWNGSTAVTSTLATRTCSNPRFCIISASSCASSASWNAVTSESVPSSSSSTQISHNSIPTPYHEYPY